MKQQGYDMQQITETLEKIKFEVPEGELAPPPSQQEPIESIVPGLNYMPSNFPQQQQVEEDDDLTNQLTEEDKLMLRVKWGKTYKPDEWIQLEKLYNEMMESYDIQSAGHIDTLKMICKTSLKANQLLDIGDKP